MRAQRLPRGRRSGPATVVALALVVLAGLGAAAAVQIRQGHHATVLGHVTTVTHWLHRRTWTDPAVPAAGIVLAVLGALLLLAGLLPARRSLLPLAPREPGAVVGISRAALTRHLAAVASAVDGIAGARARLRRRQVTITARSALRDTTGLAESVHDAVEQALASLAPATPLHVRAHVTGSGA